MDLSYMKDAAAGMPEDLQRLKWAGMTDEFEKYAKLHCQRKDLPDSVKRCIELELYKLKINAETYTLTEDELIAELGEIAPGFSAADLEKIALDLDWAFVDGRKRYYSGSRDALMKSNPVLRSWPGLAEELSDGSWVRDMTRKIKEKGSLRIEAEVERKITVSGEASAGRRIRVDIPYPQPSGSIMKEVKLISADRNCLIADETAPTRTAVFTAEGDAQRSFAVRYRIAAEMQYMSYEDFLAARKNAEKMPDSAVCRETACRDGHAAADFMPEDLQEQTPAIVFSPFIRALSEKIVGDETDKIVIAKKIYDYMLANYRYSYVKDYAAIDHVGEYFAVRGLGDCGLQSLLFITLCRYNGIPARWESGVTVEADGCGCHDWAQVYLEGTGWRPVDCSFGGGAMVFGDKEAADFYFGNIDPYRIVFNRSVMAEFDPPKQFFRIDPYDNQIGEAETEEGMLDCSQFSGETKVLWIREY